ncbi:MAG: hypothetical protein M0T70_03850 [Geobacteraceae bacterium]|nr:hypothetical protein [Geobacteraceae bacterium]
MDTTAIAGSALLMKSNQTQQVMSISIMKQAANQQNLMANLLAQNASQAPRPAVQNSGFTFSTFA